jgi:outer membrane lipoprotein-sorting protein
MKKKTLNIFLFLILSLNCGVIHKEVDFRDRKFSIEEFKKELSSSSKMIKSFIGKGVIYFESKEYSERANAEIYMKFPDSIFVKLEGPFGIDLANIFITENELKYYNIKENCKYVGEYNVEKFEKLTGANLKFLEIIELLSGRLNFDSFSSDKIIDVFEKSEGYYIVSETQEGFEEYLVDKRIWQIKKYVVYDKNKEVVLEKRFDEFEKKSNFTIPKIIRYIKPDKRITLIYKNISINEEIDSSKFDIKIPENVKEIIL